MGMPKFANPEKVKVRWCDECKSVLCFSHNSKVVPLYSLCESDREKATCQCFNIMTRDTPIPAVNCSEI